MPSDPARLKSRLIPLARHVNDAGRDLPWVAAGHPLPVHFPALDGKTALDAGLKLLDTRVRGLTAGAFTPYQTSTPRRLPPSRPSQRWGTLRSFCHKS